MPRRHFLEGAAAATLVAAALASGRRLSAAEAVKPEEELPPRDVTLGLIGCGIWGKQIAASLTKVTNTKLKTVCDSAEVEKAKVAKVVPDSTFVTDYKQVLEDKAIEGVIIATPTHLHKQIVLDAIAAGKHVYCEAPLAVTMEDLVAICQAARDAQVVFQPGLQRRCHPLTGRVKSATVDGSMKTLTSMRSQARRKLNWMRAAATPERAKERSWQAYHESSLGPIGELGIHQIDVANLWMGAKPKRLRAIGQQTTWADSGMEVPDTTFLYAEYLDGRQVSIESTVASSHGGNCEEIVGSEATAFLMDAEEKSLGYLFKEAGAAAQGWETYAKKEQVISEIGIIMRATPPGGFDIAKIEAGHLDLHEPLFYSLGSFAKRIVNGEKPMIGYQKAFEANVIAIKAAQAAKEGKTVEFTAADFKLA